MKILKLTLMLMLLAITQATAASNLDKEKRWADQIVGFLIDGEAEWLEVGDHRVLAIYTEAATDSPRGGVIVIHGSGAHPNWQDVVYPLRTRLPEDGWATLSIQMPVLRNEAEYHEYAPLFDEVAPRMDAAVANLKSKGIDNIVIVAHSLGSAMSAYYLRSNPSAIKGFVGIGMPGPRKDERMDTVKSLKQIGIPVLDLYGSKDLETTLDSADARKAAGSQKGNYSRKVIQGAGHFFEGKNDELVETVSDWLNGLQ